MGKVFYWQYPGEEVNRILKAQRYDVIDEQPQFEYSERRRYSFTAKFLVNGRCPPPRFTNVPVKWEDGEIATAFVIGTYNSPIWKIEGNFTFSQIAYFDVEHTGSKGGNLYGDICTKTYIRGATPARVRQTPTSGSRSIRVGESTYNDPGIDPTVGFFDYELIDQGEAKPCLNELPDECHLEFYNSDDVLVYKRTESVCPVVWEERVCPEGTCSVDCGDHICCYNERGIPVQTIPKG